MFTSTYTGEGTLGNTTGGFGSYGFIIFFLFILWFFFDKNKEDYCNQDMRADNIATTAEARYNNLLETRNSKEAIMAQASAIRNEQQAETIFDLKIENNTLKQNNVLLEKFASLNAKIDALACETPKRPPYYSQGFVTCGTPLPQAQNNGFCYNV